MTGGKRQQASPWTAASTAPIQCRHLARVPHHVEICEMPVFLHGSDAALQLIHVDEVDGQVQLVQELA